MSGFGPNAPHLRPEELVGALHDRADRTPDECIAEVWGIANGNPDYCEPAIRAWSDQWWAVVIECQHGKFRGQSHGLLDVSTGYRRALAEYRRGHPRSSACGTSH